IEAELVCDGAKWGKGPAHDVHSGNRPRVDSPAFHLVQALASMVSADGVDPAIDHFADAARPLSPDEERMLDEAVKHEHEETVKKLLGVTSWVRDLDFRAALGRM